MLAPVFPKAKIAGALAHRFRHALAVLNREEVVGRCEGGIWALGAPRSPFVFSSLQAIFSRVPQVCPELE